MEAWHYTDLLKAHKMFIEKEGRSKFYEAYIKCSQPGVWLKSSDPPHKEGLLLFGWVLSWDPHFEGDLRTFYDIHSNIFCILKGFEGKTIVNIDLNDSVKNSVCEVFNKIAQCCESERFESTAASKILHAFVPELFVMWDRKIRQGVLGDENRKYGEHYAYEFLPKMQDYARQFLNSYIEEHGGNYADASKQISQMAGGYTLAKLIDEFNYVRFTWRKSLTEIRRTPNCDSEFTSSI